MSFPGYLVIQVNTFDIPVSTLIFKPGTHMPVIGQCAPGFFYLWHLCVCTHVRICLSVCVSATVCVCAHPLSY